MEACVCRRGGVEVWRHVCVGVEVWRCIGVCV